MVTVVSLQTKDTRCERAHQTFLTVERRRPFNGKGSTAMKTRPSWPSTVQSRVTANSTCATTSMRRRSARMASTRFRAQRVSVFHRCWYYWAFSRPLFIHTCICCAPPLDIVLSQQLICDDRFLADRTNGRAYYATLLRLSVVVVCRVWRYVLWLNGAS